MTHIKRKNLQRELQVFLFEKHSCLHVGVFQIKKLPSAKRIEVFPFAVAGFIWIISAANNPDTLMLACWCFSETKTPTISPSLTSRAAVWPLG
jgi:hypothetical protein